MIVEFILFGVSVAAVLVTVATIIYAQVAARREVSRCGKNQNDKARVLG